MIELGKKYKTRLGLPAKILSVDIRSDFYPVCAAILLPDGTEEVEQFTEDGKFYATGVVREYDLIEEV